MTASVHVEFDHRDRWQRLVDDHQSNLIRFNQLSDKARGSCYAYLAGLGLCFALPFYLSTQYGFSRVVVPSLVFGGMAPAAGVLAFKSSREHRKYDELIWEAEFHVNRLLEQEKEADIIGHSRHLAMAIESEFPSQPQQPQHGPQQMIAVPPRNEWQREAAIIEAIFREYGKAFTIKDKVYAGDRIEYEIFPSKGVKITEIVIDKNIEGYLLYAGYEDPKVQIQKGRLVFSIKNPDAPKIQTRTQLNLQQREKEPIAAAQPQEQQQQPPRFVEDGPSFTIVPPTPQQQQSPVYSPPTVQPDIPTNVQMGYSSKPKTIESMFPEEDIAQRMADSTANQNSASSLAIFAPRGCGKTGLLQNGMWATWKLWKGVVDFHIWAGKDGETYCGLENDPDRYLYSGNKANIEESVLKLEELNEERCAENRGFPTIFIKDENNNTLRACKFFDDLDARKAPKFKAFPRMSAADYEVITKGRSKLCLNWMTAHSPRKVDTGQETSVFYNTFNAILGRTTDEGTSMYGLIKESLSGQHGNSIIDDIDQRALLLEQFTAYRKRLEDGLEDGTRVLCLTNFCGPWRLVLLPRYEKDVFTIEYKEGNPADESIEIAQFDKHFKEEHGADPDQLEGDPWYEDPINAEDEDEEDGDYLPGVDAYQAIADWIAENHPSRMTDANFPDGKTLNKLWIQWYKQHDQEIHPLNEEGIRLLREIVNRKRGLL